MLSAALEPASLGWPVFPYRELPLHLSWCQTPRGKSILTIHRTPTCTESCAEKIWDWRPLPVVQSLLLGTDK